MVAQEKKNLFLLLFVAKKIFTVHLWTVVFFLQLNEEQGSEGWKMYMDFILMSLGTKWDLSSASDRT